MIEPLRSGEALLSEIRATHPDPGHVAVWWLGQSGFLLKSANTTVLVDPYLSEHLTTKYAGTPRPHIRMTRAPLRGSDLIGVDYVLASHRHSDHLDPLTVPALLASNPNALLLLPDSIRDRAVELGLPGERLIGLVAGQTVSIPGGSIRAVPSAHEGLDIDSNGCHLYLGFVITLGGRTLYHSGDTLAYENLVKEIGVQPLDAAFLPINGRDPSRGVPGNMNAKEAVALANQLGARYLIPHHYDMFTFNTVPIATFAEAARGLAPGTSPVVLRCGELWEIRP